MKKALFILTALLLMGLFPTQAQVDVTFKVDMSVWVSLDKFDPATDDVRCVGTVFDPNWSPADTPIMDDTDGDLVYEVTYQLNAGNYEYKYVIGNDWGRDEALDGNRTLTVETTAIVLDPVMFQNVTASGVASNVTFNVDMTYPATITNEFDPATDVVRVAGDFNGWSTDATELTAGENNMYSVTVSEITSGAFINFKFIYVKGGEITWEDDPNRQVFVVDGDNTFEDWWNRTEVSFGPQTVTFKCDMTYPATISEVFDPATDQVGVAGSFNDWNTTATVLELESDYLYSASVDSIDAGQMIYFKFIYNADGAITWEDDPNREYFVIDGENEFQDYWNRVDPNVTFADGNVTFNVDMGVMIDLNMFTPGTDTMQIRGGFNGWGDSDPDVSIMNQDPLAPSIYYITIPFNQYPVGDPVNYKYYVDVDTATHAFTELYTDWYERPISQGGGNRTIEFQEGDTNLDVEFYDDIDPEWVIPDGTTFEVTFRVDMTPATDPLVSDPPFNPETDTVKYVSGEPVWSVLQGFNDDGNAVVFVLEDPDGDLVYEGTYTMNLPAYNAFEYVYEYVHVDGDMTSSVRESTGYDDFEYRVRYVGQDNPNSFPTLPWTMPMDTWTTEGPKTQEVDPYESLVTSVRDMGLTADQYVLEQNYPNPFNPSTTIRFNIPEAGVVSLKVFNVLGQEVAQLVSQELTQGFHEVDFDASQFSTGIYFYTIQAGDFVATKKMMLLK